MRSAVLWLLFLLALLVQAQPPPSLASLQAQLEALKAQLPPTCNGSSFLQRNSNGWLCVTPVRQSGNSSGWCRASQDGSETITCDVSPALLGSPPDCRPPGGKWLGFNSTLGGWICVCNAGWSGTSCNVSTGVQQIACSTPQVCVASGWTGLYQYVNGAIVCQCLQGWSGLNCSQQEPPLPPTAPARPFTCIATNNVNTCAALGDLYTRTNGASWTGNTGWSVAAAGTPTDYCTFYGVECRSGIVIQLCVRQSHT